MGTPPHEKEIKDGGNYSAEEVRHLIAREANRLELAALKSAVEKTSGQFNHVQVAINSLRESISAKFEGMYRHTDQCRDDLRQEIERDFVTKVEMEAMRGEVKILATKITIGVAAAVFIIQGAFWFADRMYGGHTQQGAYSEPQNHNH